jgi:hypothetical protein
VSDVAWQIEPLGDWGRKVTKHRAPRSRFTASWTDTMSMLTSEISKLGLRGVIAVRVDVQRGDIRQDGKLYARATAGFPGVVVSFQSRYGPLSYATDAYDYWQANVRAIALSLQALRAVDRYGVSKSGEQYVGWRAIGSGAPATFASADEAIRWLRTVVDVPGSEGLSTKLLLRTAASALHPDRNGGDSSLWERYDQARQLIQASQP